MADKKQDSSLVSVKSVREGEDLSQRKRVELTLGEDRRGVNGLQELIEALQTHSKNGNPVKLDIRIGEQTSKQGRKFPTAFVLVKEVVPMDDAAPAPKNLKKVESRADRIKARASDIESALE